MIGYAELRFPAACCGESQYLTNIEGIDLQDVFYEFQGKADLK